MLLLEPLLCSLGRVFWVIVMLKYPSTSHFQFGLCKILSKMLWYWGTDRDIEELVRDCEPCLLSGKTGQPDPTQSQPVPWPSRSWEHLHLDICEEIYGHGVPPHQCFLAVIYNLHSKWPEVVPAGTVISQTITRILDSLFACWCMPRAITTDKEPQLISAEFSTFLSNKGIKHMRAAL